MKKFLLITTVLLGGAYLYGRNMISQYEEIVKELKLGFEKILNVHIQNGLFTGRVVLSITNPTTKDLGLKFKGLVTLKRLLFYTPSGLLIGAAYPEISNISIGANEKWVSPEIPFEIPFSIENILNVGYDFIQNSNDLKVVAEVEILGKTHRL